MSYLENYVAYEEKHLGILNDVWNRCEYDRLRSLKPTDVVIDAGASMGAFTVKASLQTKYVYAFEPEPENYMYLARNTDKLKNVKIFQKAIWSHSETRPFYVSSNNWGGHSLMPKLNGIQFDVETVTLDAMVKEKVDFLKVDVEATELELFKGATRILKDKPFIAIEIHNKEIFQNVADFLAEFDYTCKHGIIDSHIIDIREPTYGTVYFEAT